MLCVCCLFYFLCLFVFSPARRVCTWTVLDRPFDSVSVFFYYFYVNTKTSRHFSGAPVYISFRFLSCSKNFYFFVLFFPLWINKEKNQSSFPKEAWRLEFRLRKALICKPNSTWLCRTFSFLLIESLVASSGCLPKQWRVTRRHRGLKPLLKKMENRGGDTTHGFYWRSSHPASATAISWREGEKEGRKGNMRHSNLWELPFRTDQCTKFVFAFYVSVSYYFIFFNYYYFNQDSSLQCLLRGVGGSHRTMRKCQESGAAAAPTNSGGLKVFVPAVIPSRLLADIQPENVELTRSPASSRSPQFWSSLIFLFLLLLVSPLAEFSEPPLLGLSKTLNVWTWT